MNRNLLRLGLLLLAGLSSHVRAEGVADCKVLANDSARLACYDKATGVSDSKTGQNKGRSTPENWEVIETNSKMDDSAAITLGNIALEEQRCGSGKTPRYTRMAIRCLENTTDVIFLTGCLHFNDRDEKITYRIDKEKPVTINASASTNRKALGLWGGGKSIPLIKSMIGKEKLLVRMAEYNGADFDSEFDISHIEDVIQPLRDACHW